MEMQKNNIMEAVLSGKLNHDGNQAVAIANICKAVEGYLPMLEQLGEVMNSFWDKAEEWGFLEITGDDVDGMKIPAEHLETLKRVRNAMLDIANPMNQNMFFDYLDYGDKNGSYMDFILSEWAGCYGASEAKEHAMKVLSELEEEEKRSN